MSKFLDITGQKYGRLTALYRVENPKKNGSIFLFECECGIKKEIRLMSVKTGRSKSCGCLQKELAANKKITHGNYKYSGYRSWLAMIYRCTDPKSKDWKYYGGRGIKVCDRWLDINNFIIDMGERPDGHSIDRINPNENYEPKNCKWADAMEQGAHKRNVKLATYKGVIAHIAELSRIFNIPETTMRRNAVLL
jgi:hypothetical protein